MNHNKNLIKIFNNNKHLKHVLTNKTINKMCNIENRFPLTKLPVCNSCESLALWHGDNAFCEQCGTLSKNPIQYSEYLVDGYDIDATGATFRYLSEIEKTEEAKKRILYVPKT